MKDVSHQQTRHPARIEQVGLKGVELPLKIQWGDDVQNVMAVITAVVSLDDVHLRGIHMSRIYLALEEFSKNQILNLVSLQELADKIIKLQKGLSSFCQLRFEWKGILTQKSLVSSHQGTRVYPCYYQINMRGDKKEFIQGATLLYSSTCPCSASLSRDLIQESFKKSKVQSREEMLQWLGQEESIAGTPHSQRSQAKFKVKAQKELLPHLIQGIENVLVTNVQSAVKREDEKQFAHLNAKNLMYSEDAIRKIKHYLDQESQVKDYWVQVSHLESLHPFDTVAQVSKHDSWVDS